MSANDTVQIRVAAVILYREGRVLLQHRDDKPEIVWPNHWAIFGGHIEDGETPEQAALREIEEELGLRLEPPLVFIRHQIDGIRERFIFAARLGVPLEELTLMEGQGMALLTPEELFDLPVVPAHHAILLRFFDEQQFELL
jgi:8-oxo-dGTP pyrophosphatase MutT (NUDIX family)